MNFYGILFTLIFCMMLLRAPTERASLPLLLGSLFITKYQQLELGPMHFSTMRALIAVGIIRIVCRRERISGSVNSLDKIAGLWAIWNILSILFHRPEVMITRLGVLFDLCGAYYLFRVFLRDVGDIRNVFKMICLLLVPLAATMLIERFTGKNLLSVIGFGPEEVTSTNGHFRAQGPFAHPILAGTVGAVSLPMAVYFWRTNRKLAFIGLAATLGIVFASGSSGPIMTTISVIGALALWKIRGRVGAIRWLAFVAIAVLNLVMNEPVYYLMARIDITGGSTGYFRARLIQSAFDHLSEWWLVGTDYTRQWMETGIDADPNSTDITNYYLLMGVWGGLPLALAFMWLLIAAFLRIGRALRTGQGTSLNQQFLIWALGCILFAHGITFWSICYFDQTIVFLCLVLACVGSLKIARVKAAPMVGENSVPQEGRSARSESGAFPAASTYLLKASV